MNTVAFVVPEGIGDPQRVSGGNVYDARVSDGLAQIGWDMRTMTTEPNAAAAPLSQLADGALVLIDGLVAARSAAAVEAESWRLRIVVLAHMVASAFPDADPRDVAGERQALAAARRVVATSAWTKAELVERGLVEPDRIVVAPPGTDAAAPALGSARGTALLCLGVVAPHKGQDVLVEALADLDADVDWTCTIAGSLETIPAFAHRVADDAAALGERVRMPGVLAGTALDDAYRDADLLVAPSRVEAYGMAVTGALGRGIPVVASDVGGIPEAVAPGHAALLVPPGDARALADALERWMADPRLRERLTAAARSGRERRPLWSDTAARVAAALEEAG
ncbi:glycosyltransferase family 4 protein [Microbacterium sp. SS28]|uniref:glycosyltransferase family 4 protein n=1 Tax=Microbacterium sp. SS28 TaxID=2919948 RepID=UPI001FAADE87|nr:glycosyltransferase family 4 protein [Microbacterium sp. SS28]